MKKYNINVFIFILILNLHCKETKLNQHKTQFNETKSVVIIVENMKYQIITNAYLAIVKKFQTAGVKIVKTININDNRAAIIPALKKAVALKPSIICLYQTGKIESELKKRTAELHFLTIPVVMSNHFYTEKIHPKITGLTFFASSSVLFKLWKRILPNAKKIAILGSVTNDYSVYFMNDSLQQAKKAGYHIDKVYRVMYGYEFKNALLEINKSNVDFIVLGLWLDLRMRNGQTQTPEEYDDMRYWIARNVQKGVGAIVNSAVVRGLTFAICTDDEIEIGKEIADLMISILKGKKVEDMPIETPRSLYLSVNIKHAKKIGLTIPYEILNETKYIYDKFVGEYDDAFFKKHTAGAVQPRHPDNWDWIPK